MITFKDVSFKYPKTNKAILNNLSIEIESGLVGLIGKNGAGKSTILKLLLRIEEHDSGEIIINGQNIKKLGKKELAQQISWVSSNNEIYFRFAVEDILRLSGYPHNRCEYETQKIIKEVSKLTGSNELLDKQYSELSSGEKQKVQIARALCQKTPIILLDEPFQNLDVVEKERLVDILVDHNKSNAGLMILVSHDLDVISKVSDKVFGFKNGLVEGVKKEAFQNKEDTKCFLKRIIKN